MRNRRFNYRVDAAAFRWKIIEKYRLRWNRQIFNVNHGKRFHIVSNGSIYFFSRGRRFLCDSSCFIYPVVSVDSCVRWWFDKVVEGRFKKRTSSNDKTNSFSLSLHRIDFPFFTLQLNRQQSEINPASTVDRSMNWQLVAKLNCCQHWIDSVLDWSSLFERNNEFYWNGFFSTSIDFSSWKKKYICRYFTEVSERSSTFHVKIHQRDQSFLFFLCVCKISFKLRLSVSYKAKNEHNKLSFCWSLTAGFLSNFIVQKLIFCFEFRNRLWRAFEGNYY